MQTWESRNDFLLNSSLYSSECWLSLRGNQEDTRHTGWTLLDIDYTLWTYVLTTWIQGKFHNSFYPDNGAVLGRAQRYLRSLVSQEHPFLEIKILSHSWCYVISPVTSHMCFHDKTKFGNRTDSSGTSLDEWSCNVWTLVTHLVM